MAKIFNILFKSRNANASPLGIAFQKKKSFNHKINEFLFHAE